MANKQIYKQASTNNTKLQNAVTKSQTQAIETIFFKFSATLINNTSRFYRFSMHSIDYAVTRCLSIRLSVTHRYSVETVIRIIKLSYTILVFHYQTVWQHSDGDSLNGGVECKGYETIAIFDQYPLYLGNDTRYYGRRIGNRTQAFEWCRFQ